MLLSLFLWLAVVTVSARAAPGQDQDQDQALNEVWAPGPSLSTHKNFPSFSFKTLIKALVRFNSVEKTQTELLEATTPPDDQSHDYMTTELPGDTTLYDADLMDVPTPGPVEDDALNIKPIVKPDKSYRFTHNFRFGYGALPGLP